MPVTIERLREFRRQLDESPEVAAFYERFPRNAWWNDENRSCSVRILTEARDVEDMIRQMQATYLFSVNADSTVRDLAIGWCWRRRCTPAGASSSSTARAVRGRYGRLLPCRGERNRVSFDAP